jgi:putative ABC transport system permease protein
MVGGDLIWTGMLGAPAAFSDLATSGAGATALLKLRQGVDSRTFATELRRAAFGQGVDAVAAADLIALNNQSNDFFNSFFTLLLQTGVVVGVLSLGFLALRAAIERKRAIGVLRALGYMPGQVLKGLLIEAGLTASIGIVVGIAVGLGLGLLLVRAFGTAHPDIAWSTFLAPAALIYAAVFLMTIVPAIRASRMPVAEALRIVG